MPHPQISADVPGFFDSRHGFGRDALLFRTATDPSPALIVVIEVAEPEEFEEGNTPIDATRRTVRVNGNVGAGLGEFIEYLTGERYEIVNVDERHDGVPTLTLKRVN